MPEPMKPVEAWAVVRKRRPSLCLVQTLEDGWGFAVFPHKYEPEDHSTESRPVVIVDRQEWERLKGAGK